MDTAPAQETSSNSESQAIESVNTSLLAYRYHYPRKLSKNITIHAEPLPISGLAQPAPPNAPPFHTYVEPNTPAIYFAAISEWGAKKPDIVLHRRIDEDGEGARDSTEATGTAGTPATATAESPVVGVVHTRLSRHFKLGIGDPSTDETTVKWEDMKNTSPFLGTSRYEFSFDIGEGNGRKRRKFEWKRTSAEENGVKGWRGRWSLGNYKLLDDEGEIIAVFLDRIWLAGIRCPGVLGFKKEVSMEVEILVVLSCTGLVEKIRRTRS